MTKEENEATSRTLNENKQEHKFTMRIPTQLWKRFLETLPESISANSKIEKLIFDYVVEYENALTGDEKNAKRDNRTKDK